MISETSLARHRGPFTLNAFRVKQAIRFGQKREVLTKETVARNVAKDEVMELIDLFLTDPRDDIRYVEVWSEREEQFVGLKRATVVARRRVA